MSTSLVILLMDIRTDKPTNRDNFKISLAAVTNKQTSENNILVNGN